MIEMPAEAVFKLFTNIFETAKFSEHFTADVYATSCVGYGGTVGKWKDIYDEHCVPSGAVKPSGYVSSALHQ